MQSMLVIGLGRFGNHLALNLMQLGNEVMVIDKNEEIVNQIAPQVTQAKIGDCMKETVLETLGVSNFDVCFVCISEDFQSSLEITSLLKEFGATRVIAKADREIHAKFLKKIGADEVIHPERDMAQRTAVKYSARHIFDYIEFTPEYAIFEVQVPTKWVGKSVKEVNVRSRYHVNVIGQKTEQQVLPITSAEFVFQEGDHLLLAGSKKDLLTIAKEK